MRISKRTVWFLFCLIETDLFVFINSKILSRNKRYVAFPEGSTWVMAFCMTTQTILPNSIFTEGVNWGIAYDLPNRTTFTNYYTRNPYLLKRRHRRDMYNKLEVVMDSMGFDGRSCILRALCEAPRRLQINHNTLSEEIIRLLFKFPQQTINEFEPEEHQLYHSAYRQGRENKQQDCTEMFPTCTISLIDLALGYYNDYS